MFEAYQITNKALNFKVYGEYPEGLNIGDKIEENFQGNMITYEITEIRLRDKIYGVDYKSERKLRKDENRLY